MNQKSDVPSYLIDGVHAVAIHNGVARIMFMKMNMAGQPEAAVELMVPIAQVAGIIEGLQKVGAKR